MMRKFASTIAAVISNMTPEYFLPHGNRSHQNPNPASAINTAQIAKSWSGPMSGNDIVFYPAAAIL
jgi:hypothetical protein